MASLFQPGQQRVQGSSFDLAKTRFQQLLGQFVAVSLAVF